MVGCSDSGEGGGEEGKRGSIFTLVNYANLSYRDTNTVWKKIE